MSDAHRPRHADGSADAALLVPVILSSEIAELDGPQVRVKILGEKLLAFRDSSGVAGLIDEFCGHRAVSLFFGRDEECGIRCFYHGSKYDVTGACVELPQKPDLAGRILASRRDKQSCSVNVLAGPRFGPTPRLKPRTVGGFGSMI
jgi:phenylpropionate dioxygenase-like ring-hydroxylating dioxygenase large terminal subunit